jgi:histone acetyltransferase (RNA polymerase elongator complex component)
MKKHAIIPVFIPHRGCPHDCVFCNQVKITARTDDVTPQDVNTTINEWLSTIDEMDLETVEVAFYGGSFTGLTIEEQNSFLDVAKAFKDAGRIDKIHLSTRPDYIDKEILDNLKSHSVDVIELGVQSFDDEVLKRAGRGHDASAVYRACDLIKSYGFELGIQLMIGLPGDSYEKCVMSAREAAAIGPDLARLYPTLVLDDTHLYDMYKAGTYEPLTREEAVRWTKAMYEILDDAGIYIMRVGLKSTDLIRNDDSRSGLPEEAGGSPDSKLSAVNGGTYHPAFRQLVEGRIARERIEALLAEAGAGSDAANKDGADGRSSERVKVDIFSSPAWYSNMVGNASENRQYFLAKYPQLNILYKVDKNLADGEFRLQVKDGR